MWFKKKEKVIYPEIVTSREKLNSSLDVIIDRLSEYRQDEGVKDLMEVIQIGKNIAVLDAAKAPNDQDRIRFQAKVEAYHELQTFIEAGINRVKNEIRNGKGPVRGTIRSVNRTGTASAV